MRPASRHTIATRRGVAGSLTLLALFAAPGRSQDAVLVPGTPPLTQKAVDRDIEIREFLLRLKLSPSGRRVY